MRWMMIVLVLAAGGCYAAEEADDDTADLDATEAEDRRGACREGYEQRGDLCYPEMPPIRL